MTQMLRRLVADEDGQDLVEYGLLMMLMSLASVGGIVLFRDALVASWLALVASLAGFIDLV